MAIKKIIFKDLWCSNGYPTFGGVRFYNPDGSMLQPGALISSEPTHADFPAFSTVASSLVIM